jgi:hypothetical protein
VKAVLDVESGRRDEAVGELPDAPLGVCPKYLLHKGNYCGRKIFEGSDYCYWHTQSRDKYLPESIASYFGESFTLSQALEKEVADGRSLESAYLVGAPLGGNWFVPGCNLTHGKFHRANLSGAHLSY